MTTGLPVLQELPTNMTTAKPQTTGVLRRLLLPSEFPTDIPTTTTILTDVPSSLLVLQELQTDMPVGTQIYQLTCQ